MTKEYHPAADIFPMMSDEEIDRLAEDIKANGLLERIVKHPDGRILDGRNRYEASQRAGIEPMFVEWNGKLGDEIAFVLSKNLARRHLSESQRAMAASRVAVLKGGRPSEKTGPIGTVSTSQTEAASALNVGVRSVKRARKVLENGVTDLVAAVEADEIPVSVAAEIAKAAPEEQIEAVERIDKGEKPADVLRSITGAPRPPARPSKPSPDAPSKKTRSSGSAVFIADQAIARLCEMDKTDLSYKRALKKVHEWIHAREEENE